MFDRLEDLLIRYEEVRPSDDETVATGTETETATGDESR